MISVDQYGGFLPGASQKRIMMSAQSKINLIEERLTQSPCARPIYSCIVNNSKSLERYHLKLQKERETEETDNYQRLNVNERNESVQWI